jgi:Domain of unknown function (DUF4347)/Bacterial Ig-like domain
MPNQLVVIDPSVANYQSLIDQLGAAYSYLLLNADSDGVTQIANYVAANPGFDAIHLISHGSPGQVAVGTATLSEATLGGYTAQLHQIGASLNAGADLLIYGCDVAASTNRTGGTGDWVLEAATTPMEHSLSALAYESSFAVPNLTVAWSPSVGISTCGSAVSTDDLVYLVEFNKAAINQLSVLCGQLRQVSTGACSAKCLAEPNKIWTKLFRSDNDELGYAIVINPDCAVYVAGASYSPILGEQIGNDGSIYVTGYAGGASNGQANNGLIDTCLIGLSVPDISPPTIVVPCDKNSLIKRQTGAINFLINSSVSDFDFTDINLAGGTLNSFAGSGTTYTASFTPAANSNANGTVSIESNRFSDAAGCFNFDGADANNSVTMTVDTESAKTSFSAIGVTSNQSSLTNPNSVTCNLSVGSAVIGSDLAHGPMRKKWNNGYFDLRKQKFEAGDVFSVLSDLNLNKSAVISTGLNRGSSNGHL